MESGFQYPDYIPFFNLPSGGSRGGLNLLSDSNLDWGQDLRLLSKWQDQHSDLPIYMCYFGMADPAYYKIARVDLPYNRDMGGGYWPPPNIQGILAISATNLQGTYMDDHWRQEYRKAVAGREPIEVLGGSIYLYTWPPPNPNWDAPDAGAAR
jgi:hypothetical protein